MEKDLVVYDGNCKLCKLTIKKLKYFTKDRFNYVSFQDFEYAYSKAVHIISRNATYKGAEAIFYALKVFGINIFWVLYKRFYLFKIISDFMYKFIATHRKHIL
ncbi:MAG: DUF393 domain-containing protein [bacterium]|nr:DUF393 domain-containing protein [bacterium]